MSVASIPSDSLRAGYGSRSPLGVHARLRQRNFLFTKPNRLSSMPVECSGWPRRAKLSAYEAIDLPANSCNPVEARVRGLSSTPLQVGNLRGIPNSRAPTCWSSICRIGGFNRANLFGADLTDANLSSTNIRASGIVGAELFRANHGGAVIDFFEFPLAFADDA